MQQCVDNVPGDGSDHPLDRDQVPSQEEPALTADTDRPGSAGIDSSTTGMGGELSKRQGVLSIGDCSVHSLGF